MTAALVICAWQTFNALVIVAGVWVLLRKAEAGVVTVHVRKPPAPRKHPEVRDAS